MIRTKKMLVSFAIAAAATGIAASPAFADSHIPTPPRDGQTPVAPLGDSHIPVAPQGDSHIPAPPQG
ncbi:hypothetical protein AB0B50_32175 [Streptomyces sp. NPDC041068]|uniref:hypothetical protein n=1 Tax=Streptomyces sp. NPDC041068 TaxID=3155130 RepID=UPI0033F19990